MVGDCWDVLSLDTKEMICMFSFKTFLFTFSKNDASEYKNIMLILASSKHFWDITTYSFLGYWKGNANTL